MGIHKAFIQICQVLKELGEKCQTVSWPLRATQWCTFLFHFGVGVANFGLSDVLPLNAAARSDQNLQCVR